MSPNTSESATSAAEAALPTVLVVRDPDASDDIRLFGLPVDTRVIYLDLGASFDIHGASHWDRSAASEWVESKSEELIVFPPGHGSRSVIEATIAMVCERFGLNRDGSYVAEDDTDEPE